MNTQQLLTYMTTNWQDLFRLAHKNEIFDKDGHTFYVTDQGIHTFADNGAKVGLPFPIGADPEVKD
jgi:hypothetical protein